MQHMWAINVSYDYKRCSSIIFNVFQDIRCDLSRKPKQIWKLILVQQIHGKFWPNTTWICGKTAYDAGKMTPFLAKIRINFISPIIKWRNHKMHGLDYTWYVYCSSAHCSAQLEPNDGEFIIKSFPHRMSIMINSTRRSWDRVVKQQ